LRLQQRAKSKITFPLVWTNTCLAPKCFRCLRFQGLRLRQTSIAAEEISLHQGCSHPLYGMKPCEVDEYVFLEFQRFLQTIDEVGSCSGLVQSQVAIQAE